MIDIEELFKNKYRNYVKIFTRITGGNHHDAEDIVMEGFERAVRLQRSYDPKKGSPSTWMNSIVFNCFRDHSRSDKEKQNMINSEFSVEDVAEDLNVNTNPHVREYIESKIAEIKNEKHRSVVELFFLLGFTSLEICQIEQGVSRTNVTTIINRFKEEVSNEKI